MNVSEVNNEDILMKQKSEIERVLENSKGVQLKEHTEDILKLAKLYYELDLKSEYSTFLDRFVFPIGQDSFMNSTEITFFIGLLKYNANKFEESLLLLEKSIEIDGRNYKALNTLACISNEINPQKKTEYINLLKKVLDVKEDYYRCHLNIAIAYEEEGDNVLSDYHYNRAIELQPNVFKIYQNYSYFLMAIEKYEQCMQLLSKSLILFSSTEYQYQLTQLLSECSFSMNQFDESLQYAEKCISLDASNYMGYFNKGNALFSLASYDDAIINMIKCIDLKQKSSIFPNEIKCEIEYYNLGLSYIQLNQYDLALTHFKNSLKDDSGYHNSYKQIMRIYNQKKEYVLYFDTYEESIINTKKQSKTVLLEFLDEHSYRLSVYRIDCFMSHILAVNFFNIEIVGKVFNHMSHSIAKADYTENTKHQIYHKICYLLADKYKRYSQSILLLIGYNKIIKSIISFQSDYSIWDLLID